MKKLIVIVIILILIFVFISIQSNSVDHKKSSEQQVKIGEQGYLCSEDKKSIPVAISKPAFDAWSNALVANDSQGASELLSSGQIFIIDDRTPVLRLTQPGLGLFVRQVRILKGEYQNRVGWVQVEYLKKTE